MEQPGEPQQKKRPSGGESSRKNKRISVSADALAERSRMSWAEYETRKSCALLQDERARMIVADAESLWRQHPARNQAAHRPQKLSFEGYLLMRDQMMMYKADAESQHFNFDQAKKELRADSESWERAYTLVRARLTWHENVRDVISNLSRSRLLEEQGLPRWIVLEAQALE